MRILTYRHLDEDENQRRAEIPLSGPGPSSCPTNSPDPHAQIDYGGIPGCERPPPLPLLGAGGRGGGRGGSPGTVPVNPLLMAVARTAQDGPHPSPILGPPHSRANQLQGVFWPEQAGKLVVRASGLLHHPDELRECRHIDGGSRRTELNSNAGCIMAVRIDESSLSKFVPGGIHRLENSFFRNLLNSLRLIAARSEIEDRFCVFIAGDSGTGKSYLARNVIAPILRGRFPPHRSATPALVTVDVAALNETTFLSEVFGHKKGAFSGADSEKQGLVEVAGGDVLFLDEIGKIPKTNQGALLRFIQDGTFYKVGGTDPIQTSAHLIFAAREDLRAGVAQGTILEDLYNRISSNTITLTALRERNRTHIPAIAASFWPQEKSKQQIPWLFLELLAKLESPDGPYAWPGNYRELDSVVRNFAAMYSFERPTAAYEWFAVWCGEKVPLSREWPVSPLSLLSITRPFMGWWFLEDVESVKLMHASGGIDAANLVRQVDASPEEMREKVAASTTGWWDTHWKEANRRWVRSLWDYLILRNPSWSQAQVYGEIKLRTGLSKATVNRYWHKKAST